MEVKSEIRGAILPGDGDISCFVVQYQDAVLDAAAVDEKLLLMILSDVEAVLRGELAKRMRAKYAKI